MNLWLNQKKKKLKMNDTKNAEKNWNGKKIFKKNGKDLSIANQRSQSEKLSFECCLFVIFISHSIWFNSKLVWIVKIASIKKCFLFVCLFG